MHSLVSETLVERFDDFDADSSDPGTGLAGSLTTEDQRRIPFYALLFLIVALMLRPWDFVPLLASMKPITLMILGMLGLCAISRVRLEFFRTPLSKCLFAFWLILMATSLTSYLKGESLVFSIKYVQMLLLYGFLGTLVCSLASLSALTTTLVGIGGTLGLYAIYSQLTSNLDVGGRVKGLGTGFLGDPNDLSQVLVALLPLAWLIVYHGRQVLLRLLSAASALVMLMGIVITESRGGLLALIGSLAVLFVLTPAATGKKVAIIAFVVLSTVAAIPAETWQRYASISEAAQSDDSAQTRLRLWKTGGRMFVDHMLIGTGVNTFATVYGKHYKESGGVGGNKWYTAHNSLIQIAVEAGILGAITWTLFAFSPLWLLYRARSRVYALQLNDPDEDRVWQHSAVRAWCECMLASMTGLLIGCMFLSRAAEVPIVLFVGVAAAGYLVTNQWSEETEAVLGF
ncbi:MAG: O-antigen ligase family protein [Planctomycetota bacterium]